jgi:hypothetical protein
MAVIHTARRPSYPRRLTFYFVCPTANNAAQTPECPPVLQSLLVALTTLEESLPLYKRLPPDLDLGILVPLAGFLLEYPAVYVPSAEQTTFLSGVPLDVYECNLVGSGDERHVLLKFSCPHHLGVQHPQVAPPALMRFLYDRFTPQLGLVAGGMVLTVNHNIQTHDRVAL